jgi:Ca-activated chloride channel family protein
MDLEGTYIFPLPEETIVRSFSVYVDGKKITGEIIDKEEARQTYEDLVRNGGEPALLEYVGKNMFKAKVYPIPKHSGKRVELIYQQVLKYDNGLYTYEYPLDTERFSPKPIEEVTISTEITSNVPIKNVYSPSHKIDTKLEKTKAICSYEEKNIKPDKNFILHYSVSQEDLGLNILCYRKPPEDGYFMLLLSPGQIENRTLDKDIIFVLDTSGSMQGKKIKQAKDALKFCIHSLREGDRFNIITFASTIDYFKDTLISATESNVNAALKFVDEIEANGGTNINDALFLALRMLKIHTIYTDSGRPRMIVFLTDGEPTEGVTDFKEILENLSGVNITKTRIFVFGVGEDVNTQFLEKVSEVYRGTTEYVLPDENIEFKVSSFYRKVSEPILSDVSLDFGDIKIKELYPVTLPDIFKGAQLILLGRYENQGQTKIILKGKVNDGEKKIVFEANFPQEHTENDFIPKIWATRKIGYLLSEIRLKGENKELKDEVVRLSKEYGVMTPHTSFLLDTKHRASLNQSLSFSNSASVYRGGMAIVNGIPIEGMSSISTQYGMTQGGMPYKGIQALSLARDISSLKEATIVNPILQDVKYVGDKTFYKRQDGYWVDSKYKEEMKIKEIKYLSKEYFELIKKNSKLAKYFGIGKNVIVVYDGECYRIKE